MPKRPAVSEAELWAAQAQFGPFGDQVIRAVLDEWRTYVQACNMYFSDKRQWLQAHKDADEIVVDAKTGEPYKAVYRTIHGIPRDHVAEFYFNAGEYPEW